MCCGLLFCEVVFLVVYVVLAPAVALCNGPNILLHLYIIYTGYSILGMLLSSVTPFLREIIQLCVCGIVMVSYPLALVPDPVLGVVYWLLLLLPPLLSCVEGYVLFHGVTQLSRKLRDQIEEHEAASKGAILSLTFLCLGVIIYINTDVLDLHVSTKLLLLLLPMLAVTANIYKEEGIISDVFMVTAISYLLLAIAPLSSSTTPLPPPPPVHFQSKPLTMLGAIVRLPQLVSYSVTSVIPLSKSLLSPLPLGLLAVRVITVAIYGDKFLGEDSSIRNLGKFLVISFYTSYILTATQSAEPVTILTHGSRIVEIALLYLFYLKYLISDGDLTENY